MIIGGIVMICAGVLGTALWSLAAIVPVMIALAGVIVLAAGLIRKFRTSRRESAEDTKRPDRSRTETGTEKKAEERRQLKWELERIRSERREKEIRRDNIREEYEEYGKSDRQISLEEQCRALDLAAEQMQRAAQVTGDSTGRRVSRRASEIFAAVTDGKYRSLEADPQKGITVWDGERRIPAGRLSRGTVEQIYFCIRMAAAEMLTEEPMPVILDDVFAFYDDKRLESVLKWLSGQGKQVIIFTCHKREEEILLGKKSFR